MTKSKLSTSKLILVFIGSFIVGGIAFFYSLNNYIYQQKQKVEKDSTTPYKGTLVGEYVCLPHKDTSGPQTLECALGIVTDVGEYYSLDFSLMSQRGFDIPTGSRISANGLITPIENVSSNHWQKYNVEGIFSVTDSLQILD